MGECKHYVNRQQLLQHVTRSHYSAYRASILIYCEDGYIEDLYHKSLFPSLSWISSGFFIDNAFDASFCCITALLSYSLITSTCPSKSFSLASFSLPVDNSQASAAFELTATICGEWHSLGLRFFNPLLINTEQYVNKYLPFPLRWPAKILVFPKVGLPSYELFSCVRRALMAADIACVCGGE